MTDNEARTVAENGRQTYRSLDIKPHSGGYLASPDILGTSKTTKLKKET